MLPLTRDVNRNRHQTNSCFCLQVPRMITMLWSARGIRRTAGGLPRKALEVSVHAGNRSTLLSLGGHGSASRFFLILLSELLQISCVSLLPEQHRKGQNRRLSGALADRNKAPAPAGYSYVKGTDTNRPKTDGCRHTVRRSLKQFPDRMTPTTSINILLERSTRSSPSPSTRDRPCTTRFGRFYYCT